jgi:phage shock protein PspC (stress-responsive transcriptional regulator)
MKKTIKISLGSIPFIIEDDAYKTFDQYLKALRNHFGNNPESEEIVRDIEERASELFTEMLKGKEIVTDEMVDMVIETLGKPEQIDGESEESSNTSSEPQIKRRLYRDADNPIIAGVCSGLGTYFNVDPLVFRIIFIVLLIPKGFGLLIYLVLWLAVPKADTVRQKMEMRGEPINLSNLEKNIKHEFEEVKKNMGKHRISNVFERIFHGMGKVFMSLGTVLGGIAIVITSIMAIIFISIGLLGLLATTTSMFFGNLIVSLFPAFSGLTLGELLATTIDLGSVLWITIPVFLILAIPFTGLIYLGIRMVFRFKVRDSIFFVTGASIWISAVVVFAFVLFLQARSFTIRESVKEEIAIESTVWQNNTLHIVADSDEDIEFFLPERIVVIDEYTLANIDDVTKIIGRPKIYIGKSENDTLEMIFVKKSRGASRQLARGSAERIVLNHSVVNSKLIISPFFYLPNEEKWRAQEVEILLNIPEGQHIYIDRNVEKMLAPNQEYSMNWPDEMVGKTWVMKGNKLREI